MIFKRKDFLGLRSLESEEIHYILNTAETMKYILTQKSKKSPHLQGKSAVLLFYEQSSRSRLSFELAAQYLSANTVDVTIPKHLTRGESLKDMGRIIDQMGTDFIIIRHPMAGAPYLLAEHVSASVINAGDGQNENPSQALLDLMTIKERKGSFEGLKVAIIGDIAHNRVAKSNIWGLVKLGAEVCVAGPPTLIPAQIEKLGVKVFYSAAEALIDADVIMSLRMQVERQDTNLLPSLSEYKHLFKIDKKRLQYAKPDAIVMHPGPINRGIEIASEVIDCEQCLINDQITNGVAVRMALLYLLSKKGGIPGETID